MGFVELWNDASDPGFLVKVEISMVKHVHDNVFVAAGFEASTDYRLKRLVAQVLKGLSRYQVTRVARYLAINAGVTGASTDGQIFNAVVANFDKLKWAMFEHQLDVP